MKCLIIMMSVSAGGDGFWFPGQRSSITDRLHVVAGVRTGVADDGSSSLAASIPVGAATTGGRGRVRGTTLHKEVISKIGVW